MGCFSARTSYESCPVCGFYHEKHIPALKSELSPGIILKNRYVVGKILGDGAFGITYLGFDTRLQAKIAIKEYFPRHLAMRKTNPSDLEVVEREREKDYAAGLADFLGEARKVAAFDEHHNIMHVKDFFSGNNTGYMIMPFMEGETLKEWVADHRSATWEEIEPFVKDMLDGVNSIHEKNMLHLDISPDNIFVTAKGSVKLIDFGSSSYAHKTHTTDFTRTVRHEYSPLEQYSKKTLPSKVTDIYSLGATIYFMTTGEDPPNPMDRMQGEDLKQLNEHMILPKSIEKTILTALSLHYEDRPADIEEMREMLYKPPIYIKSNTKLFVVLGIVGMVIIILLGYFILR